jgi:hypothetical protein
MKSNGDARMLIGVGRTESLMAAQDQRDQEDLEGSEGSAAASDFDPGGMATAPPLDFIPLF